MMTANDLKQIEGLLVQQDKRLEKKFATKDDLNKFATKSDLKATERRLEENIVRRIKLAIEESEAIVVPNADKHKADRFELEKLDKRVTKLEQVVRSM